MFKFFSFIGDVIGFIVDFVVNIAESFTAIYEHIVGGIGFVVTTVGFLPPFCQGALLAIVGISILALFSSIFIDFG